MSIQPIVGTIIIDGTDLMSICDSIETIDTLYAVPAVRGDNNVIDGVDGEEYVDRPYGTGIYGLGLFLNGASEAEFNSKFRQLKTLMPPGKKLSLQRVVPLLSGNEIHQASGEYESGLNPTLQLVRFSRVSVSLKLHDGVWYDSGTRVVSGPGVVSVAGETRTHRMTFTMPAGGTITNSTTGHSVSNTATGADITVDNEAMTATQGATDVSNTLSWTLDHPMRLMAGNNTLTGSATTITYRAAYL